MAIQASESIVGFPFCGESNGNQDLMLMNLMMESNSYGLNHHQQHQNQFDQFVNQNQNQRLVFDNSGGGNQMLFQQQMPIPIPVQVEKQRQEIDHYLRSQNERLRLMLQEQKRQQLEMLMKKIESKAITLLRQKDEEIAKANNRTMEAELLLKRLEMENQAWQRMAMEYETMVFSLNNTLEQMRDKANNNSGSCCFNGGGFAADDAESCCDVEEEKQLEEQKQQQNKSKNLICKSCNSADACVLFLPCRHLCACKCCDAFLDSCPVCLEPKKASIEALI